MPGRTRTRRLTMVAAVALLVATPLALHAQSRGALRRARQLLERLKLVDGAGSGLDADTVHGVSPLVVRDANGAAVGTIMTFDSPVATVVHSVNGRSMRLYVMESGFVDSCPALCFENADCSGTPYREASDGLLPLAEMCGTTVYYPVGQAGTRTMARCRIGNGPCTAPPSPVDQNVTQVATFDVSTLGLVPPFHAEGP